MYNECDFDKTFSINLFFCEPRDTFACRRSALLKNISEIGSFISKAGVYVKIWSYCVDKPSDL